MSANFLLQTARPSGCMVRELDRWGSGLFGAPRGARYHRGIDYVADEGDLFLSPVGGQVTKIGWPYGEGSKNYFRYVQVTDYDEYDHRFFYVMPSSCVQVSDLVNAGQVVGVVQDIAAHYSGMMNHVHYEIKKSGEYFDPNVFWSERSASS